MSSAQKIISWDDFAKLDIRVGTVIEVKDFPKALRPSYQLWIDFGELGIKKSSAQITAHYTKDMMKDRQVIAVVNFPVKQIANFHSECLVLGVIGTDQSVILLQPSQTVENGCKIG